MRKSFKSLLIVFPVLMLYSAYGCASPTPVYNQNIPEVRVAPASEQLAQRGGGEGMARQECTAINTNNNNRYMGRSRSYPRGQE